MQLSLRYMNWNYFPAHYEGEERFFLPQYFIADQDNLNKNIFICSTWPFVLNQNSSKLCFWEMGLLGPEDKFSDSPWQTPPLKVQQVPPRGGYSYTYSNSSAGAGFNSPYYWLLFTPCTSLHHADTAICNATQGTQTGNWSGGKNNNLKEVAWFSSYLHFPGCHILETTSEHMLNYSKNISTDGSLVLLCQLM